MSKLEELIARLCPDGVEYKKLCDCVKSISNINWNKAEGQYRYIDLSSVDRDKHCILETQVVNADNAPSRAKQIILKDDVLVGTTRPLLKRYCIIPDDYDNNICSTGFCVLRAEKSIVLPRWIYHNVSSNDFFAHVELFQKGASYPAISDKELKEYKLPVPPLEVQREIVHILDSFTSLTKELEKELAARQKQYEFYRDALLTFKNIDDIILNERTNELEISGVVRWMKLKDIADIGTGSSNTNEAVDEGVYPFFVRSQEPLRKNTYEYDETAIITAGDGVGVGKIFHFVNGKYALHQRAYRIHINVPYVMPKYFFYYMKSDFLSYINKNMFQGSVSSIRRPMLNDYPVPVPPLAEQQRIVDILDRFDALCNDITSGLPAEIEARKKQYEYYRDKLLTFKELKKEA